MSQYFHFTLGPVQGFVAQARRTRDFWAGSFVLSWLAAVAMREVTSQGGKLVFPQPDRAFLTALEGVGEGRPPLQGNTPNRFFAEVPGGFDPRAVAAAVGGAWQALADTVWQQDLATRADQVTRAIWRRQTASYWEVSWACSPDRGDSAVLDRRKNWRNHLPPPEPGIKCMVMDGLQELSGAESPLMPAAARAQRFWQALRDAPLRGIRSDLADGEQLCAIAYIKRRFPRYFGQLRAPIDSGWTAHGWRVPTAVPSVAYLAAAPWLAQLLEQPDRGQLDEFHRAALALTDGDQPEWDSNVRCVREAEAPHRWKALDGSVFFDHALDNPRLWSAPEHAGRVRQLLGGLRRAAAIEPVSPFYAVLLMDGDSLGSQMSQPDNQTTISQALATFTAQAPGVVDHHNGFLIYSGGDDILALLPLEHALPCAAALRQRYLDSFAAGPVRSTLSGAIEYAHVRMPLTRVLQDAHQLLDDIAKDETGRDAIACRVWKPGGLALQWSMPWQAALDPARAGSGGDQPPVVTLQRLADRFRADDDGSGFANRFIYRIRERLELLNPVGGEPSPLQDDEAAALMAAEYLASGINQGRPPDRCIDIDQAVALVTPLLQQCRRTRRRPVGDGFELHVEPHWSADAALLLRFLAHKGIEQ